MNDIIHTSGSSGRGLIFVHGRGSKPGAESCQSIWVEALSAGIEADFPEELEAFRETAVFVGYYGDLANAYLQELGETYDEQVDVTDLRNALHELEAIDRKKGFGVNRYDRLPGKSAYREFAVSVFSPLIKSIGLGKKLVSGMHKDLGEYWRDGSRFHDDVLARVRDTLKAALDEYDRIVVLSHGTGSIITYDALWQLSHDPAHADTAADLKIDQWITMGAPLGDSLVQKQLKGYGRDGRERFPTNVLSWHNVSAEDDYMSHDNTVCDDFKAMLTQRQISSIRDYRIYNMAVRYGKSNPHNVVGYLIHPRVSKLVAEWLRKTDGRSLPKSP
ncbi:MAG: hypothetical protein AAGA61_10755 [Pseudomonadota bacterium]